MKCTTEKDGEDTPKELRPVLQRLAALYGLWSVEKHLATLYQGMYMCHLTFIRISSRYFANFNANVWF